MQQLQIKLPTQLQSDLNDIKRDLENLKTHFQPKKPQTYLSRAEVSKMLNVSFVTLNKWNKSGRLKAVGIGGRVLYRQSDIDNAIVEL
ncbi:helix-turn-helix domain-containing protein [Polaribacter sargassicola]|uniref:helix-turn-helix domain-containing protein n=1 Tax=Polaribacter sargassicola TaxID=2836891 RepID=UPI001F3B98C8|nr:helix-turn-helix domain-containing protein [Polaribacter sp. DS7-9]MCG1035215.1 helix-turn-helix domain-containing protein [Polaribacter sp. DS7-9]